jgi:opacity protein-like surface antigen
VFTFSTRFKAFVPHRLSRENMMNKTVSYLVSLALGAFCVSGAVADDNKWYVEGAYAALSASESGTDVDVSILSGFVGYQINDNWAVEGTRGFGIGDDTIVNEGVRVKVEANTMYGILLKPSYSVGDNLSGFLRLGYADTEVEFSAQGVSEKTSSTDFVWGAGFEYDVAENVYLSLSYLDIDDLDGVVFAAGYRF